MTAGTTRNQVILHHNSASRWLRFQDPVEIVEAGKIEEIVPALEYVETGVRQQGCFAAGFLSYEAASAFDPALRTKPPGDFPLLWFGLFERPEEVLLPDPDFGAYSLGKRIPSVDKDEYFQAISEIKRHIHSGDTYQVNYTLQLRIGFSGDPWNLFLAMVRAQSPGYAAWVDTGRYAVCSASPELFFNIEGNRLICKPMKGTVKRGRTLEEDAALAKWLQESEKNRAENLMIVDMIRNDLGRVADAGSVRVDELFEVERHPTLWQMTSTIRADSDKRFRDIMAALFPCASITGAPKIRTTGIIAELEKTTRNIYTGCIGFIAPRKAGHDVTCPGCNAQFNVAIRTAVVDRRDNIAEYGTGGGIVWDSASGEEYTEALLKAKVLTEQRPDFSLLETLLWTRDSGYFLIEYHMKRLADSAQYFGYPVNILKVEEFLIEKASGFTGEFLKVRLLIDRFGSPEIESSLIRPGENAKLVQLRLAREPVSSKDIFMFHKTTLRNIYEAALQLSPGCDDVVLWNERGELTESCVANIVLEIDGGLYTPPVTSGLLAGVFRAWLLDRNEIRERVLTRADLENCSKIYLINSVRKWREAVLIIDP